MNSASVAATRPKSNNAKPNKFNVAPKADRTLNGINFDSKREMQRFSELSLLEKAGQITNLRRQVPLRIDVNGQHICIYKADFQYFEDGKEVTEDSKGVATPEFKLKAKLVRAVLGITIRITK